MICKQASYSSSSSFSSSTFQIVYHSCSLYTNVFQKQIRKRSADILQTAHGQNGLLHGDSHLYQMKFSGNNVMYSSCVEFEF